MKDRLDFTRGELLGTIELIESVNWGDSTKEFVLKKLKDINSSLYGISNQITNPIIKTTTTKNKKPLIIKQ